MHKEFKGFEGTQQNNKWTIKAWDNVVISLRVACQMDSPTSLITYASLFLAMKACLRAVLDSSLRHALVVSFLFTGVTQVTVFLHGVRSFKMHL